MNLNLDSKPEHYVLNCSLNYPRACRKHLFSKIYFLYTLSLYIDKVFDLDVIILSLWLFLLRLCARALSDIIANASLFRSFADIFDTAN